MNRDIFIRWGGGSARPLLAAASLVLTALLMSGRGAVAQNIEGQIIASQYGTWKVPGYAGDTYSSFAPTACRVQGGASFFSAFTAGVPIRIVDGNPSLSETVTPTAVSSTNSTCSVTIHPLNHHQVPFYLTSATAGLQEAIDANLANPQPNTIILNNDWYRLGGSTAIIASVHGSQTLGLVDVTKVPTIWYKWNGSQYVEVAPPSSTGGDTQVNDLFANNSQDAFEDLYHFYATSPTYTAQNAINAAATQQGAVTIQPGAGHTPFSNPSGVKVVDNRTDVSATERSVKEWGAQCDATLDTGSATSGSAILTRSSGSFTSADIGKTVAIAGFVSGVQTSFMPTITAVSGATATLSTPAPFTVSNVVFTLGHLDTAAIEAAITYQSTANVTLTIPNGACLTGPLPEVSWLRGFARGSLYDHGMSELVGLPGLDVIDGGNGTNGDWGSFTIGVDQSIDPTKPWNIVDASGTTTSQTPNYRPLAANSVYSNNPLGPGWLAGSGPNGSGSIVGVGSATNGSATLTVASAAIPTAGETVLFPLASTGLFVTTVSSVSGSAVTLAANFPGTTAAQEEFFAGSSAQNIQTEITSGQTMPFTITLANSIDPTPVGESNVAPYGLVEIGDEEFAYIGYSKVSPYTITLTARAQNGTTAADHAVNSVIVPLNPFQPTYPWPVTPTINSGATTPANASYYPAFNVGNCGICTPLANGADSGSQAFYQARVHDISILPWGATSTDPDAGIYLVQPPYATRFQNINITFTNSGFVEGMPSVNNHPWIAGGISGDGNSYSGISIHSFGSGMAWATVYGGDTSYRDFDLYTDGGSGFNLFSTYDDQTGALASLGESAANFINIYHEPGGTVYPGTGTAGTTGPMGEWDCTNCTWTSPHIEPNGEIVLSGIRQHIVGGGLGTDFYDVAKPVIVYGADNIFDDVAAMWNGSALTNVYGQGSPIFWGPGNVAYGPRGSEGSPQQQIGYGCGKQPTLGQTNETFNTGNLTAPYVNSTSGLICPDEFNTDSSWASNPFSAWTFDATAPISQGYTSCAVGTASGCQSPYFTPPARITIGSGQRLAAGKYIETVEVKGSLSSNTVQVEAFGAGTGTNTNAVPVTNAWTTYSFPVDFTGAAAGAYLTIQVNDATSADTVEIGYVDFAPVWQQLSLPTPGCNSSPVLGIANSSWTCPQTGWGTVLGGPQGASDTTATLASSPAAYSPAGCFYIDSEAECYTGISGDTLTGLSRGMYHTTAASHASGAVVTSLTVALGNSSDVPGLVVAGNYGAGVGVLGINNGTPSTHSSINKLVINSGGNETDVLNDGSIQQANLSATNHLTTLDVGGDIHQPIAHSDRVLKSDEPNTVLQPYSFLNFAGPVNITTPATYGAPSLFVQPGTGSTTYSYECTGVDSQGNTIGGTVATITNGSATLSNPSNYVQVTCPYEPGAVTTNIWRTVGGPDQGLILTGTTQPVGGFDFGGAATGGSPPGTTSIPEACIGTACWSSGASAPSGSCNSGSLYTNTSNSPDTLYVCKSGAWAGVM